MTVAFGIAENRGILRHLGDPGRLARSVSTARHVAECPPDAVDKPHLTLGPRGASGWSDDGPRVPGGEETWCAAAYGYAGRAR